MKESLLIPQNINQTIVLRKLFRKRGLKLFCCYWLFTLLRSQFQMGMNVWVYLLPN